jgi:uncharacterized protein with HEPN domain
MQPEIRKLLTDMYEAAEAIAQFVKGKSRDDLKGDRLLRSGIYYQFMIIGEALAQLRQADDSIAQRISEYPRIIGFRNQIIHGYAKIDDEITWRLVQDKLPILFREVEQLLSE